jgi:hypothetical protein
MRYTSSPEEPNMTKPQIKKPISKSGYMYGIQCPLLLWTHYNRRQDIPPPDAGLQFVFDLGHAIGDMAKQNWPAGMEVEHSWDPSITAATTRDLMTRDVPIFEASFFTDRRYCRVDILEPVGEGRWDLIEVKAATSVKPQYIHDVAFQADVLRRAGVDLRELYLMHVNNQYVRQGAIDPAGLLHQECVTDEAMQLRDLAATVSDECLEVMDGAEPEIGVGRHCHEPYTCALKEKCHAFLPPDSPLTLYYTRKVKAYGLIRAGYRGLVSIPVPELSEKQQIQQHSLTTGEPHVEVGELRDWLDGLEYPLYHLDFETMNPGIPLLDGTRPFQQIPFQVSIHIQDQPGAEPRHIEFLADQPVDPRPGLIEALEQISSDGTILAYNASFEIRVLDRLAQAFPAKADFLLGLIARVQDLLDPFRGFHLYHPDQHGSCSIKAVLPAFTSLSYDDMDIHEGQQASREFVRAVFGDVPEAEREKVLRDLRAYCAQDTMAMVELLKVIQNYTS